MKRFYCIVLALALLCAALPAVCAEELADVRCGEMGFSTKMPAGLTAKYAEGDGLQIFTGTPGSIPYVIISRRPMEMKFSDPVGFLNNVYREYLENKHGDNMLGMNPCKEYEVGGKKLLGARYFYRVQEYKVCLLRLIEVRDDGDVEYTAKFIDGQGDATLAALDTAVGYYETDGGTNDDLLSITVDGKEYTLGISAVNDFTANGWTYTLEKDGVFDFCSPENESSFMAKTVNGKPDGPVVYLDMMWADGVPVVYHGYNENGEPLKGQDESLWDWLVRAFDAEQNDDGTLIAKAPLSSGNHLQIETKGVGVRLSIVP